MRKVYTGIDVGTHHVKVVIAAPGEGPELPMHILGTGTAISRGLRHGYITETNEAMASIREALHRAASQAKVRVRRARVALSGVGLDEIQSEGVVTLTPSGGYVSEREIDRALRESEKRASSKLANRHIIHTIPIEYHIDGTRVFGKPHGLQGTKLTVKTLLITMLAHHHDDLIEAVEGAGVEVEGTMAGPLAASLVTLSKAQKAAGVVLANIGAETLSLIVFDEDTPISIKVFPTGSADITNTIALSLKIPLTEAEQFKRGAIIGSEVSPKKMHMVAAVRFKEMLMQINAHLKSIGRARLLPAGIVFTGGGSGLASIPDVARAVLKIPAQISQIGHLPRSSSIDATWSTAYGLTRWAYAEEIVESGRSVSEIFEGTLDSIKQALRALLP